MVGKAVIYMVEIVNKVQALSLNYGTITRDSPVRSELFALYYQSKSHQFRWMKDFSLKVWTLKKVIYVG